MCDYSLHHVATRPAKIEDKLVTTKFNNSITRGAAAVGEPNVAVCLLPGRRRSDTSRSRPVPGWPETPPTHFVAVAGPAGVLASCTVRRLRPVFSGRARSDRNMRVILQGLSFERFSCFRSKISHWSPEAMAN